MIVKENERANKWESKVCVSQIVNSSNFVGVRDCVLTKKYHGSREQNYGREERKQICLTSSRSLQAVLA